MKKLVSLVMLVAALTARLGAQDFEGTVVWKMSAEVSDPKLKARMEQMSSPEMQAKLAQAQAAMNTPEMQAMMKQNPQMRAMIEKQMGLMPKPGAAAGGAGGMFPSKFICKTKGARALILVEGGMFPSETLSLGDQQVAYLIDRGAHTYRKLAATFPGATAEKSEAASFKVTPTSETTKILGYTCTRCVIEQTGGGGPREHASYVVWVTKDIPGLDSRKLAALRVGRDAGSNFMGQLDGVPLKIEIATPQAKMVMQADSITREALPAATFELPTGFTEAAM